MPNIPRLSPPLMAQGLTCWQVHKKIQEIDVSLPVHGQIIPIDVLSDELHVDPAVLSEHINVLHSLKYIKFTDHNNGSIRLTDNGRSTVVPD